MDFKDIRSARVSGAVNELLDAVHYYIDDTDDGKVFYFHGWSGFGVTPVLRSILQELPSMEGPFPKLCHHRLIYIDCSDWKNRRSLQKKIAEELKFDHAVMDMFDKQDEEDDFSGVGQASRDLIREVSIMIDKNLRERSFLIIFLNGSDEEIDLTRLGVPSFSFLYNNIMIWSFKRRFLTIQEGQAAYSRFKNQLRYTHVFFDYDWEIDGLSTSEFSNLLREEADSIVDRHPCIQGIDLTTVTDCCLFEMFLYYSFHSTTGFAWASHACNFWICDGIIKGDQTKEICNTLYPEIRWECDASLLGGVCQNIMQNDQETPFVVINGDTVHNKKPACRWVSLTSKNLKVQDRYIKTIMEKASSLFIAFERTTDNTPAGLPDGLFKHCSNLGGLVLSCCAFNFASPPFLRCRGLRFLGVDNCTNDLTREGEECTDWEYLYNLWVLDLRYTDWDEILAEGKIDLMANLRELNVEGFKSWQYTIQLQTKLPYLERLRIIRPMQQAEMSDNTTSNATEKTNLEILDLSGNSDMKELPTSLSNASRLQMLVLDGCDGLENIDELPSSLTSFSLDGYGPASRWTSALELPPESSRPKHPSDEDNKDIQISKIPLRGCTQLNNLFLRGLSNLMELDLSGSALKTLDFESMVVDVPRLKRLFLLGCQHLRAIKWGSTESGPKLEFVCIDTRPGTWAQPPPAQQHESSGTLQLHAVLADVRLARSLWTIINREKALFDIRTTSCLAVNGEAVQLEAAASNEGTEPTGIQYHYLATTRYADVLAKILGDASTPPMEAFPEPPGRRLDHHVEITGGGRILESELRYIGGGYNLADVMINYVEYLHVHDASISVSMPAGYWSSLRWCRMERCPRLEGTLFHQEAVGFTELEVVWVSELAMAHCLWSKKRSSISFRNLQHLRLRSCPRLQYALPLRGDPLSNLKTIHVVRCGGLRHVFALREDQEDDIVSTGIQFPELTTIHLHDLPMLRGVCEVKMFAPKLEAVRIRGCFNLRRLPAPVEESRGVRWPRPTVEVEKDVWDALEWDGVNAGHHPSYYEPPVHSRHYRNKRLLRPSLLR